MPDDIYHEIKKHFIKLSENDILKIKNSFELVQKSEDKELAVKQFKDYASQYLPQIEGLKTEVIFVVFQKLFQATGG